MLAIVFSLLSTKCDDETGCFLVDKSSGVSLLSSLYNLLLLLLLIVKSGDGKCVRCDFDKR